MRVGRWTLAFGLAAFLGCGDSTSTVTPGPDTGSSTGDEDVIAMDVEEPPNDEGKEPEDTGKPDEKDEGVILDPGPQDELFCQPSYTFCSGNTLFVCADDGATYKTKVCDQGCTVGGCFTDCAEGKTKCLDTKVLGICQADGSFKHQTCTEGVCKAGACTKESQLCEPATLFCQSGGGAVLQCASDGLTAAEKEKCPFGCDSDEIKCKDPICQKGQKQCAADPPNWIEVCNEEQLGWTKTQPCKINCIDGACEEPVCDADEKKCGENQVLQCAEDLLSYDVAENCSWGCLTNLEAQPQCAACKLESISCDWFEITECKDELTGFEVIDSCDFPLTCAAGQCVDVVIVEEGDKNASMLTLMTAFLTCWNSAQNGVCLGINTQAIDYDITEEDFHTWLCDDDAPAKDVLAENDLTEARDMLGCADLFDVDDFEIKTGAIHGDLDGEECYAFNGAGGAFSNNKGIIIDSCEAFVKLASE